MTLSVLALLFPEIGRGLRKHRESVCGHCGALALEVTSPSQKEGLNQLYSIDLRLDQTLYGPRLDMRQKWDRHTLGSRKLQCLWCKVTSQRKSLG